MLLSAPEETIPFEWTENRLYLKIKESGWIPFRRYSITIKKIQMLLKSFIGLSIAQNLSELSEDYIPIRRGNSLGVFIQSDNNNYLRDIPLNIWTGQYIDRLKFADDIFKVNNTRSDLLNAKPRNKWEILQDRFSMIKSIYTKEINKEHDCRLIRAAEWYFLSLVEPDLEMSLIMGVICLEALLGETEQDVSITSRLSDRCSFLLAENIIERKQIKDDIKYHYCPNVCYDSVL